VQVVLKRRAGDEQPRVRREEAHHLRQLALLVLDPVRLVDDQVAPH